MTAATPPPPRDGEVPWCNLPSCPEWVHGGHRITTGRCIVVIAAPSEPPVHPILGRPLQSGPCPTCSGPSRETVGMACQTCGTDYGARPSADSPTPGTETCPNGCHLDYYGTHQGPPDCDRLPRDPNWNNPNPAGPTERLAAPSPVGTESPAEAQQDEERPHMTAVRLRPHYAPCDFPDHPCSCGAAEDRLTIAAHLAALAARPSADTETLRARIKKLAKQYQRLSKELPLGPAADAFHDAALDLRRALDAR